MPQAETSRLSFWAAGRAASFSPGISRNGTADGGRGAAMDRRLVPQCGLPAEQERNLERTGRTSSAPRSAYR